MSEDELAEFTWKDLIRSGPFRLFFPLATLAGLLGVGHWVLWSIGWIRESNSFLHASLMAKGFLSLIVAGFLMTALPRFLGASAAALGEVACLLVAALAYLSFTLLGLWKWGEAAYLAFMVGLIAFLVRRVPQRTKSPPGSFLLVGFGFLHSVMGSVLMLVYGGNLDHADLFQVGRQMTQSGFLLCMVLGIGGFLSPFLMGYTVEPACETEAPSWRRRSALVLAAHGLAGLALFLSYAIEPTSPRLWMGIRAGVVSLHMAFFAQIVRPLKKRLSYVIFFFTASWMVVLGSWVPVLWPDFRIAGLHILFIGGFSLMIFSFGTLVILSHSAQAVRLNGPLWPLRAIGLFTLLAMVLRVAADIEAWHYKAWIHAASGFWFLAGGTWLLFMLPKMWVNPQEIARAEMSRNHPAPR